MSSYFNLSSTSPIPSTQYRLATQNVTSVAAFIHITFTLSAVFCDNSTMYAAVLNIVALLAATFTVVLESAEVIFGMSGKGSRFWKIRTCRRIYKWPG